MSDKDDDLPRHRREDDDVPREARVPEWVKFAGSVIGAVILVLGWVEARFVSRVEWSNHLSQQDNDLTKLARTQADYAAAERYTANGLTSLTVDVAEIKNDVSWLRSYLDVTLPPPKRNGKKKEVAP